MIKEQCLPKTIVKNSSLPQRCDHNEVILELWLSPIKATKIYKCTDSQQDSVCQVKYTMKYDTAMATLIFCLLK